MEYRGFTIKEDYRNPYSNKPEFMFYLTSEGESHDGDCRDGETFTYTGNCKWESSLLNAKASIDEYYFEQQEYTVAGVMFLWMSEAFEYAKQSGNIVEPRLQFDSI